MLVNLKRLRNRNKNRLQKGVFIVRGWNKFNFNYVLEYAGVEIVDEYLPIVNDGTRYISSYGVCDNIQQILEYIPELITSKEKYVIGLSKIRRNEQPRYGGWRWHKWGRYIGTQNPKHEYLYDERDIAEVFFYQTFKIK